MKYLTREALYIFASLCTLYTFAYSFLNQSWQCQIWAVVVGTVILLISFWACWKLQKRKNKEIKDLAARKKALEEAVLGDERLSSRYDPDNSII